MKRDLVKLAVLGVVLAIGGFLFAWSGLFNIAASSGHWAITEWFLHFAMRQSVETHAMGIETPPLDDPAMVAKGAGHFEAGCAPCHGTPGHRPNPVANGMTPTPPHLVDHVASWEPKELFWIVKHGVKYTGMPAWPALHRDDEVWAMTAFLTRLPDLDPDGYRRLAFGDAGAGNTGAAGLPDDASDDVVRYCARCHGDTGTGRGLGAFPILAGQSEPYLRAALSAYAGGERPSGVMQLATAGLDDATLRALARHYATRGARAGLAEPCVQGDRSRRVDPELIEKGRRIAHAGVPEAGLPPCASCHGPADISRHSRYPELAGQYRAYLALQMRLFRQGARGGSPYAHIMTTIGKRLEDEHIDAASAYYASLHGGEGDNVESACGIKTR